MTVERAPGPDDAAGIAALWSARRPGNEADDLERARRVVTRVAEGGPDLWVRVVVEEGTVVAWARADRIQPPPDAPANAAPAGFYLCGLSVRQDRRRQGIASRLTAARLAWISERADVAWTFMDVDNVASRALHARFGFVDVTTDFWVAGTRDPSVPMVLSRWTRPSAPIVPG